MGRRIELGAGVAAVLLAIGACVLLLFAPLLPLCASHASDSCPQSAIHYVALVQTTIDGTAWAFLIAPLFVAAAGGAGAVLDAQFRWRPGILVLGLAAALGLLVCVLGTTGVTVVYLPALLAVELAAYGAFLWRRATHRAQAAKGASANSTTEP